MGQYGGFLYIIESIRLYVLREDGQQTNRKINPPEDRLEHVFVFHIIHQLVLTLAVLAGD